MHDKDWAANLERLQTRSDVRAFIAAALKDLTTPGHAIGHLPTEVFGLSTGSDREVLESYQRIRDFCKKRSESGRRLSGSAIGGRVRDLFGVALDRMKKLPPEPMKVPDIVPVAQVRRS
jgi:hypothetical protein